jgi:hypothetical protein
LVARLGSGMPCPSTPWEWLLVMILFSTVICQLVISLITELTQLRLAYLLTGIPTPSLALHNSLGVSRMTLEM